MSRPDSPGGRGGVRLQSRPNDIYTLLLALAAVFLLLASVLLAVEQFTFYGELFPPAPAAGKAKARAPEAPRELDRPAWATLAEPGPSGAG